MLFRSTPTTNSTVRLDELNDILNKMALGEEAVKELAELDRNSGMSGKRRPVQKDLGEVRPPRESRSRPAEVNTNVNLNEVLTDEQLANQRKAQAEKMAAEAKALLAESARLMKEATELATPETNKTNAKPRKTKKTTAKVN